MGVGGNVGAMSALLPEFFRRRDERPDALAYRGADRARHFDHATEPVLERLYGALLPPGARVLDLMAGAASHLPDGTGWVVGLGLCRRELEANAALHERVLFDLNAGPALPFRAGTFDAVVCSAGVPYLTRPLETFTDVARVLRPGGVFATAFSTRMLPHKAVLVWRASDDAAHLRLVRHYFSASGGYRPARSWGRAPERGEPIYAVWARRAPGG